MSHHRYSSSCPCLPLARRSGFILCMLVSLSVIFTAGCGIYRLKDVSFPPDIKTIKVNFFDNKAPYVNPQLSPQLTDALRRKIVNQTKLSQVSGDNADWEVTGTITDYSFSTSGISNQQAVNQRLTVTVSVNIHNQKDDTNKPISVSRSFEFSSSQTLQEGEASKFPEILSSLTDDIFNQMFSTW